MANREPTGPDIVFFMLDQLAAKWLEVARAGAVPVPNFERLAEMGTNFTRCVSSNPLCCPARATLATGLSTRGHGVLQNGYYLDGSLPTFMRALQEAGYRTGALGKVHFRPHYSGLHPDYRPYGFDVQHITEDGRGGEWLNWVRREHPQHAPAVYSTIWAREIPEYADYGPDGEDLTAEMAGSPPLRGVYELPFPAELSQTEWITGYALDFIATAETDRPLLAHISYVQPHSPFAPPAGYRDRVDMTKLPEPAPREWRDDPLGPGCFEGLARIDNMEFGWEEVREHYFADLVHLDEQLGKVLAALESRGRLEETYIVLLSDHGEMLLDHGMVSKGEMHYDACVRVPLLIAGPKTTQKRVMEALESLYPGSSKNPWRFELSFEEYEVEQVWRSGPVSLIAYQAAHKAGEGPACALRITVDGKTLAYSGDGAWSDGLAKAAAGADLFIAEANFYDKEVSFHMNLKTLTAHLDEIAPKRLILTHMDEDMLERADSLDFETAHDGKIVEI